MNIGIDIVKIDRIKKLCMDFGEKWWIQFVGSSDEWDDAKKKKNFEETLAGKFASKEAYIKAVSKTIKKPAFHDIEILHDQEGRPIVKTNRSDIGSDQLQVSISHEKEYAVAVILYTT